jgi:FG-GAP repeat
LPAVAAAQFTLQSKLVGAGAAGPAEQGWSVAVSGDGNTAIVGGPKHNHTGAAWVFTRSRGVWREQAKLVATDTVGDAAQGFSVSLSSDGDTAILGGPNDNRAGAAWVFTRSRGVWREQAKLVGTGASGISLQGVSVSLSGDGDTAIVGGHFDNHQIGAAWVFTRSDAVWSQQAKLVPTGGRSTFANFGFSVSLSRDGDNLIVGGPGDNNYTGAAWVFTRSRGVWTQQAKLIGTGAIGRRPLQGKSVSLSEDGSTAVVGGWADRAQVGAAWVFARSGDVWKQQGQKLVVTGAVGAEPQQGFSVSLSRDGKIVIVGGPGNDHFEGAAWVFTRPGSAWRQNAKLVGTGALGRGSEQGISVSLSGDGNTAIVGGPGDNHFAGAAWMFTRPVFAGTPGTGECRGQSVSALAREYGGLDAASAALGFSGGQVLQDAISVYCRD